MTSATLKHPVSAARLGIADRLPSSSAPSATATQPPPPRPDRAGREEKREVPATTVSACSTILSPRAGPHALYNERMCWRRANCVVERIRTPLGGCGPPQVPCQAQATRTRARCDYPATGRGLSAHPPREKAAGGLAGNAAAMPEVAIKRVTPSRSPPNR